VGLCLVCYAATSANAVLGVADTVVVSGDMTDMWKWPRELMQWQQSFTLARNQITELDKIREAIGSAKGAVDTVVGSVNTVTDGITALAALRDCERAMREDASKFLPGGSGDLLDKSQRVARNLQVFGAAVSRNVDRYQASGALLALRQLQAEAEKGLDKVIDAERDAQSSLLVRLKTAKTQIEVDAVQAALAASQQRIELARLKVEQVLGQAELSEARVKLERERRVESDREWAEAVAEKLRARALAALHAQTGRSS